MTSARRGSALILVLIMTLALAGLAASAIYMASSTGMLSRYHDKDRDLAFALETALELGKARLQRDSSEFVPTSRFDTLLLNQAVYTSGGTALTGITVNLYSGYTGDTSGVYIPYVTLLATVSDASGIRRAARMDLLAQSFSRYNLFTNNFPSGLSVGDGEVVGGRAHSNNRFTAASTLSLAPVFLDTVSAAGTISGTGVWADTIGATGGATIIPYPTATGATELGSNLRTAYQTLATSGKLLVPDPSNGNVAGRTKEWLEFVTVDVNNNGMIDSTEGFFRLFILGLSRDSLLMQPNFLSSSSRTGTFVYSATDSILQNHCGAFYTITGRKQFFPIAMHRVSWVQDSIKRSTYPTVSAAQATAMGAASQAAVDSIVQQPTARCFPQGSPYLMNVERLTRSTSCSQSLSPSGTMYTWGSSPAGCTAQQYGGQDTTFSVSSWSCVIGAAGACTTPAGSMNEAGSWASFTANGGTSLLPATLPSAVRQNVERTYLWPLHTTYNAASRGVVFLNFNSFLSGTLRGRATVFVNGQAQFNDDLVYDAIPADTANLCRNLLGIIAVDSITVLDNVINRPRNFGTSLSADRTTLGGNRDFIFHGIAMSLGAHVGVSNPTGSVTAKTAYTCPTASTITTSGGCMHIVGGTVMRTFAATYSGAGTGLRPARERDLCQLENRRPPYFPLVRTRLRALKVFDVDVRQVKTTALVTSYFSRLRNAKASP